MPDTFDAFRAAIPIGCSDEDRAVFPDVDLGAGLFLDAADDLPARANDCADLVHRDVENRDAGSMRL